MVPVLAGQFINENRGLHGGKPLRMSKARQANAQNNQFCSQTGDNPCQFPVMAFGRTKT